MDNQTGRSAIQPIVVSERNRENEDITKQLSKKNSQKWKETWIFKRKGPTKQQKELKKK